MKAVNSACDVAVASVLKDIEFNARNGEALAVDIGLVRQRSLVVAVFTTVVSVLMTVLIARLALRAVFSYTDVLNEHTPAWACRPPFVRALPIGAGVGLGLATVKRICEAHGGRVGLEPVKGGGSCFWFELPKAQDQPSLTMAE